MSLPKNVHLLDKQIKSSAIHLIKSEYQTGANYFNIRSANSACLCEWMTGFDLLLSKVRVTPVVLSASTVLLFENRNNTWESLQQSISFFVWKATIISWKHGNSALSGQHVKIKVGIHFGYQFNLRELLNILYTFF